MPIKVGVVGFGFMGKMHTNIWGTHPDVELTAICDPNVDALSKDKLVTEGNLATGSVETIDLDKIAKYSDYDKFLDHERLDVVDICLPTFLHCDHTVRALDSGKHVMCEKPIALTLEEADKMINAAKKSNKSLFIAHCIRFWPEYAWLKQAVDEERYGKVKAAIFKRVSPLPGWGWNNWLLDQKRSGDAALDLHIHDTDFIYYLFGKPKDIYSQGASVLTSGTDIITTSYIYDDVPVVFAIGSWGSPGTYPFEMAFTVLCDQATIEYSINKTPTLTVYKTDGSTEQPELEPGDGYTREIEYFADCIKNGRKPTVVTSDDARYALELTLKEKNKASLAKMCIS
jgi:predicted dehydrogenase